MNTTETRQVSATMVGNITRVILGATPEEHAAGMLWYQTFGTAITSYGAEHGWDRERSVALFACLSPQTLITRNWRLFTAIARDNTAIGLTGLLPHVRRKAQGLCEGSVSIDEAVRGDKVSRFYRNLSGDLSCVTVDRHAICAARNEVDHSPGVSHCEYPDVEAAYQVAAAQLGISPAQCQAIAWVVWRRQQGIKDVGGLKLVA